jgi:hypothetical protein
MSVSSSLGPDFWVVNREYLNVYLVEDGRSCCFSLYPDFEFLLSCITSPIAFWAVLKSQRISSSCLLITIHAFIPVLGWPVLGWPAFTDGLPKYLQTLQWAFVKLCHTTDELVTEKYCNT